MNKVLLINPPIYDFAAFDLWSKPLGLLYLSSILKSQGVRVSFLDYMDRNFDGKTLKSNKYGCGHYEKKEVFKPEPIKDIPRKYSRYGLGKEKAARYLSSLDRPDIILITSIMTYWYPGVYEAVRTAREIFPGVPVAIGGVYATLCKEHCAKTGADYIVEGGLHSLNSVFGQTGIKASVPENFSSFPIPDYSIYNTPEYACLRISSGCPFSCSYCAQSILCGGKFISKSPETVFEEIKVFARQGIKNITFYDDALLYKSDEMIKPLLSMIIKEGLSLNIHTPNGLHIKYLDPELSALMYKAGFRQPRFSLETSDPDLQKSTGNKTSNEMFESAVKMLRQAGFNKGGYIIYLLMGMPGQSLKEVEESVRYVNSMGAKVSLSEYSIIPRTKDSAGLARQYIEEPLYHNKSIFPLFDIKDWKEIRRIKNIAVEMNGRL